VKSEDEYLDNWVEKLGLLCKSDSQIGFLGSCFFIGVIASILWVPKASDAHGRVPLIKGAFLCQLLAQLGLFYTRSFEMAFVLMAVIGMTHPCKNIICFNYVLESTPQRNKALFVNLVMVIETVYIILITFYYQALDKRWQPLQVFALA